MNVYGRARQEALAAAAENIASAIEADEKCAIVYQNPTVIAAELTQVIAAWNTLSTPVREAILTIVKNVRPSGRQDQRHALWHVWNCDVYHIYLLGFYLFY